MFPSENMSFNDDALWFSPPQVEGKEDFLREDWFFDLPISSEDFVTFDHDNYVCESSNDERRSDSDTDSAEEADFVQPRLEHEVQAPAKKPSVDLFATATHRPTLHQFCHSKKGRDKKPSPWSNEEQEIFLSGLVRYGCEKTKLGENGRVFVGLGPGVARMISAMIGTRSPSQVRSHAQKHFQRLSRQQGLDNSA